MKEEQQNQFYSSISAYYSEIFPFNPAQLIFIEHELKSLENKSILDIGCATGELAFQLSQKGADVLGIDLNTDLLNQALQFKKAGSLHFQRGNMLELKNDFKRSQFDAVVCFGNTLVHLSTLDQVGEMLSSTKFVLKSGGKLLLQILNYDYILAEQIEELPLIETDLIRFKRRYEWDDMKSIRFITELTLKDENSILHNETFLLPLKHDELKRALEKSGFKEIRFYRGFNQSTFGGAHLPLVVSCQK